MCIHTMYIFVCVTCTYVCYNNICIYIHTYTHIPTPWNTRTHTHTTQINHALMFPSHIHTCIRTHIHAQVTHSCSHPDIGFQSLFLSKTQAFPRTKKQVPPTYLRFQFVPESPRTAVHRSAILRLRIITLVVTPQGLNFMMHPG
jgi:hypothetical protein